MVRIMHFLHRKTVTLCCRYAACDAACDDVSEAACSICQEGELVCSKTVRLLCVCKQTFHKTCIEEWFKSHASCPNCRFNFAAPAPPPPCERSFEVFFNAPVKVSQNWQGVRLHAASVTFFHVGDAFSRCACSVVAGCARHR